MEGKGSVANTHCERLRGSGTKQVIWDKASPLSTGFIKREYTIRGGQIGGQIDGQTDGQIDGQTGGQIGGQADGDGQVVRQMGSQVGRQVGRWADEQVGRQVGKDDTVVLTESPAAGPGVAETDRQEPCSGSIGDQVFLDYEFQFGALTAKARAKLAWQVSTFTTAFLFFGSVVAGTWLYMDRQMQLDRLDRSYESVQQVYNDYTAQKQLSETLRTDLEDSKVQMNRLHDAIENSNEQIWLTKKELDGWRLQAETTGNELSVAKEAIETIQKQHLQTVEQLSVEIEQLSDKLTQGEMETVADNLAVADK